MALATKTADNKNPFIPIALYSLIKNEAFILRKFTRCANGIFTARTFLKVKTIFVIIL
jgi:hypothetical protein